MWTDGVCIPTASTTTSNRHLNRWGSTCSATFQARAPIRFAGDCETNQGGPWVGEPVPGYDSDSGLHRTEFGLGF